jgi:hypothetical protein
VEVDGEGGVEAVHNALVRAIEGRLSVR